MKNKFCLQYKTKQKGKVIARLSAYKERNSRLQETQGFRKLQRCLEINRFYGISSYMTFSADQLPRGLLKVRLILFYAVALLSSILSLT